MLEHDGNNKYLKEIGGVSFGIRRHFMTNEDGDGVDGVVPIDVPDFQEGQSVAERFLANRAVRRLKYAQPNITTFSMGKLTEEMTAFLREMMDPDLMVEDDQVTEVWDKMGAEDYFGEVDETEIENAVEVEVEVEMEEAHEGDVVDT